MYNVNLFQTTWARICWQVPKLCKPYANPYLMTWDLLVYLILLLIRCNIPGLLIRAGNWWTSTFWIGKSSSMSKTPWVTFPVLKVNPIPSDSRGKGVVNCCMDVPCNAEDHWSQTPGHTLRCYASAYITQCRTNRGQWRMRVRAGGILRKPSE